jgi:SecD/SecF fusion protein
LQKLAISDGYKNAYSAIIDGNVTTFLQVLCFMYLVQALFRVLLPLLLSVSSAHFSLLFLSHAWCLTTGLIKNHNITFDNKVTRDVLTKVNFDFIGMRKKYYIVSAVAVVIVIASLLRKWNELWR